MKQEKTASEWFDMLIEPYCTQAKNYTSKGMSDVGYENFEDALSHSFTWAETGQGFFFWNNLEYSVSSGETTYLKPTDTTEYEKQLEEKFTPELNTREKLELYDVKELNDLIVKYNNGETTLHELIGDVWNKAYMVALTEVAKHSDITPRI